MVIPPKQTPHTPVQGDEANFHALIVCAPKIESVVVLRKFIDAWIHDGSGTIVLDEVEAATLVEAIEDILR